MIDTLFALLSGTILFVFGCVIGWVARKPEIDELREQRDNLDNLLDRASRRPQFEHQDMVPGGNDG